MYPYKRARSICNAGGIGWNSFVESKEKYLCKHSCFSANVIEKKKRIVKMSDIVEACTTIKYNTCGKEVKVQSARKSQQLLCFCIMFDIFDYKVTKEYLEMYKTYINYI